MMHERIHVLMCDPNQAGPIAVGRWSQGSQRLGFLAPGRRSGQPKQGAEGSERHGERPPSMDGARLPSQRQGSCSEVHPAARPGGL